MGREGWGTRNDRSSGVVCAHAKLPDVSRLAFAHSAVPLHLGGIALVLHLVEDIGEILHMDPNVATLAAYSFDVPARDLVFRRYV